MIAAHRISRYRKRAWSRHRGLFLQTFCPYKSAILDLSILFKANYPVTKTYLVSFVEKTSFLFSKKQFCFSNKKSSGEFSKIRPWNLRRKCQFVLFFFFFPWTSKDYSPTIMHSHQLWAGSNFDASQWEVWLVWLVMRVAWESMRIISGLHFAVTGSTKWPMFLNVFLTFRKN